MSEKIRLFAQRLKDKLVIPPLTPQGREKVDRILKYAPTAKVTDLAKANQEALSQKVRHLVSQYEKFTGVEEIMAIQKSVIEAQERFGLAQDRRREMGREVAVIEARLKELHAEMQNTMKGDEKYLQLCTEEHKLIIQERSLRTLFGDAEREERELFATMSAAVKLGHERERAHAERNKYWYIVASIFGTVLGIAGSSINNRLKMAEFRSMMEEQMTRSTSALYSLAAGSSVGSMGSVGSVGSMGIVGSVGSVGVTGGGQASGANKMDVYYQEKLAKSVSYMQETLDGIKAKNSVLSEQLNRQEKLIVTNLKELQRIVLKASQTSAQSDAEITRALSVVHHDLDEAERDRDLLPKARFTLEPNQIVTGVAVVMCLAFIISNVLGRAS